MYIHSFVVEGRGEFPVDMLRYDQCYPADESQARQLLRLREQPTEMVTVMLIHRSDTKYWKPTEGRWQSFLWRVKTVCEPVKSSGVL